MTPPCIETADGARCEGGDEVQHDGLVGVHREAVVESAVMASWIASTGISAIVTTPSNESCSLLDAELGKMA